MDTVIYSPLRGKMQKIAEPRLPNNANFVILFRGKDWSGFRTLAECEQQIPELEQKSAIDDFSIVER